MAALIRREAPEYVAWSNEQRRRCLSALTRGSSRFSLDDDAARMSAEQKAACCVGPRACPDAPMPSPSASLWKGPGSLQPSDPRPSSNPV